MAISVFPAGGASGFNDFVVDMNDTDNNVIDLGRSYAAGSYDVTLASGDSSFDIYALDAGGASVGYTNNATLITTGGFTTLVILGVSTSEKITFGFAGASNNATSEGTAPGAGAYLESITPSDLPNIDDTANVVGGNFATDVEIYFESGAVSTPAKQVARADSQNLIITRPDVLDPDLDPYDIRAVNPGIPEPTGSDANILAGTVTAGALPVWVTTSPLPAAIINQAYSETLEATDADGSVSYAVTTGTLPTGLSLASSTGIISGTPTVIESETFTVTATDEGGNSNSREFTLQVLESLVIGADVVTRDSGFVFAEINSSKTIEFAGDITIDVLQIGGGGSGASSEGGGGGAGGYQELSAISVTNGQSESIIIGGGGGDTSTGLEATNHSIAGGNATNTNGGSGGSGGGASGSVKTNGSYNSGPHSGGGAVNSSFGNSGGNTSIPASSGAAGGAGGGGSANGGQSVIVNTSGDFSEVGGNGGNGLTWFDGITRAGGGGGGGRGFGVPNSFGFGGSGGGGNGGDRVVGPNAGAINTGSGGGGVHDVTGPRNGGSGVVVIRYVEA